MINVLFSISTPVVDLLRNNFKKDEDSKPIASDLTTSEKRKFAIHKGDMWKVVTVGAKNKELVSVTLRSVDYIDEAKAKFAGEVDVIGVWLPDGTQLGQTLIPATYDNEGNEVTPESVIGTATYPVDKPFLLQFMPHGSLEDVNLLSGWKNRRW